jgi:interferon-induced GTP-binding protein Mx1
MGIEFEPKIVNEANWNDLTKFIADAQEHIILKSKKEVARDIVSIDMKGPYCEDLTLIDLPGIVRSSGKDESATLSDDIQSLLTDYLKNPRCVILAVHPSNVDFHNSQIMAEARKVDPDTKRTIPVLTKPDLIDVGAEESVKQLLLGMKTDHFEMGFHMVKGRGQKALNNKKTIEEGLEKEEAFFRNTEPWRSVEDKNLFTTKSLRIKLGELQMRLIRSSFNEIVAEMKEKRDKAVQSRSLLGDIPSALVEKRALFRSVKDEYYKTIGPIVLGGHIRGHHSSYEMKPSAEFHLASEDFMTKLVASRLANVSDVTVGVKVIALVEDKEVRDEVCYIAKGKVYLKTQTTEAVGILGTLFQSPGGPGRAFVFDDGSIGIERENGTADKLLPISEKMVRRDPEWIRKLIVENRPYKLPIFINTEVFEGIIADLIDGDWLMPSLELLNFTSGLMETAAQKYVNSIGTIDSLPELRRFLLWQSSEVVEGLKKGALDKVNEFICRERTPYTQNHYLYETISKLRSQRLKDELMVMLGTSNKSTVHNKLTVDLSAVVAIVQNVFERNQGKSMDDHMAEEMQHALNAYGKVALKRFIDIIPMICIEIMQAFPERINEILSNVMDDEIGRLVVAPPEKMKAMKELTRKIEILDKGVTAIKELF